MQALTEPTILSSIVALRKVWLLKSAFSWVRVSVRFLRRFRRLLFGAVVFLWRR
jgi:hypothetical protein